MKDNEDFLEDDLGLPPEPIFETKKKNKASIEIEQPQIDIPIVLNDEQMRQAQKRDVINDTEVYDTELGVNEKNKLVIEEKFRGEIDLPEIEVIPSAKKIIADASSRPSVSASKPNPPENIEEDVIEEDVLPFKLDESNPIPLKKKQPAEVDTGDNKVSQEETANAKIPERIETTEPELDEVDEDYDESIGYSAYSDSLVASDLDEDSSQKEYISRYDTIYSDKKGVAVYHKPDVSVYEEEEEDVPNHKNTGAIILMVIIGILACLATYLFVTTYSERPAIRYNLTEEDRTILTEEYMFITKVEEYLIAINDIVEEEKNVIDSYISGLKSKEDTLISIETILLKKKNLESLYQAIIPTKTEVIETKRLADTIFNNTIQFTESIKSDIVNNEMKSRIVANFNTHVEGNNSNIYMYNQYVMSVFKKRNISISVNGTSFTMDTTWLNKE